MLLGGGSERERDRWWLFERIEVGNARKSGCPGLPLSWLVHVAGLAWKAGMRYSLPKLSY